MVQVYVQTYDGKNGEDKHAVRKALRMDILGKGRRGRQKTRWKDMRQRDLKSTELRTGEETDRAMWRRKINHQSYGQEEMQGETFPYLSLNLSVLRPTIHPGRLLQSHNSWSCHCDCHCNTDTTCDKQHSYYKNSYVTWTPGILSRHLANGCVLKCSCIGLMVFRNLSCLGIIICYIKTMNCSSIMCATF